MCMGSKGGGAQPVQPTNPAPTSLGGTHLSVTKTVTEDKTVPKNPTPSTNNTNQSPPANVGTGTDFNM